MLREKFSREVIFTTLFVTLVLALIWLGLTADFRFGNVLIGLAFGLGAWLLTPPRSDQPPALAPESEIPPLNPLRLLRFGVYFVYTVIEANVQMAIAVLRSLRNHDHLKPAILAYQTSLLRSREITLLANWITLTPGTLTLEVSPDGKTLFIHTYDMGESRADFAASIARLERHVQELFH